MRELSQLYYFEKLLEEANNDLVREGVAKGMHPIGSVCSLMPEPLLNLPGCFSVRLRAPRTGSIENFFVSYFDAPMKSDDAALRHYVRQMRTHVLAPLQERFDIDISDESLRKAVEQHNQVCCLLQEISEYRKEDDPRITGYEFAVLCTAAYCCPKELLTERLASTVEELKTREPDAKPAFRVKIVVAGSEIDDPGLIGLMEEAGARVARHQGYTI